MTTPMTDAEAPHPCEFEHCDSTSSMLCVVAGVESDGGDAENWYCPEHARKLGYCWGCGQFWAGIEEFDFNPCGLCPNCKDEFEDDDAISEEEWEYGRECEYA